MDYHIQKYIKKAKEKPPLRTYDNEIEKKPPMEQNLFRLQDRLLSERTVAAYTALADELLVYAHSLIKKRFKTSRHFEEEEEIWAKANTIAMIFCRQYLINDFIVGASFAGYMGPKVLEVLYGSNWNGVKEIGNILGNRDGEEFDILEQKEYGYYDKKFEDSLDLAILSVVNDVINELAATDADEYLITVTVKMLSALMAGRFTNSIKYETFKRNFARNALEEMALDRIRVEFEDRILAEVM